MPTRWIGTLNGKVGSFPPECVEIKEEGTLSTPSVRPATKITGRGRGRGQPGAYNTMGRHSSYIPDNKVEHKNDAGDLISSSQPQRPKSNYTPAETHEELPPPPKLSSFQLPPPPASLFERRGGLSKSTLAKPPQTSHSPIPPPISNSVLPAPISTPAPIPAPISSPGGSAVKLPPPPSQLLKFSEVAIPDDDDDTVLPPPRSPPVTPRIESLPPLPPRDSDTNEPFSAPPSADTPPPKKRTKEDLRQACLQEIYQTEKDYIIDLENIISVRTFSFFEVEEKLKFFLFTFLCFFFEILGFYYAFEITGDCS